MSYDVTDFQIEVIERSKQIPVLVDFWAEWCGPCKILGPTLEKLVAQANGNWALAKVDTEKHQDLAQQYEIRSIPNVKLFVEGKVETEFTGALPEIALKLWLTKNIPSKNRQEVERAEKLLNEEHVEDARLILSSVVDKEPDNQKARVLLAKTFLRSDHKKAADLVRGIEQDSEYFDIAEAILIFNSLMTKAEDSISLGDSSGKQSYLTAIAKLRANDFTAALEHFIEVIRLDRYYDDDGSRKACIAIFKLLGEEDNITQQYRREFSRALY